MIDPEQQIIVAVTTCPRNEDRIRAVEDTWLSGAFADTLRKLIVYGSDGKPCPRMESNRVYLDCPEAYEELPLKTYRLCQLCLGLEDFDFLIKCDDDAFIDLEELLKSGLVTTDYTGWMVHPEGKFNKSWHHGKCSIPGSEIPYRGALPTQYAEGFCYILSRKAVQWIAERPLELVKGHLYEDVMIGSAIELANENGLCELTSRALPPDLLLKVSSVMHMSSPALARHPVTPDQMKTLHRELIAQ